MAVWILIFHTAIFIFAGYIRIFVVLCVLAREVSTMTDYKKRIGKRIRHIRKNNMITQEQLAEMIGVSVPYVSSIENGKTNASADVIIRLSKALHTSADIILCLDVREFEGIYTDIFPMLTRQCTYEEKEQILEIVKIITNLIENKYWKS